MATRRISVEIGMELLAAVRRLLETSTVEETIAEAFLEVLRGEARREEVRALGEMRGMDLGSEEALAEAWRR